MLYLIFLGISNLIGRAGGDLAGRVMNDKIKLPIGLLIQDSFQKRRVPGLLEESDGNFTRDTCATGKRGDRKQGGVNVTVSICASYPRPALGQLLQGVKSSSAGC